MNISQRVWHRVVGFVERQKSHYRDWKHRTLLDVLEAELSNVKVVAETGQPVDRLHEHLRALGLVLWIDLVAIAFVGLSLALTQSAFLLLILFCWLINIWPPLWFWHCFGPTLLLSLFTYFGVKCLQSEYYHLLKYQWREIRFSRMNRSAIVKSVTSPTELQEAAETFATQIEQDIASLRGLLAVPGSALSLAERQTDAERGLSRLTATPDETESSVNVSLSTGP